MLGVCITQMAVNVVLVIQNFNTAVLYAPPILWNAAALLAILAHWVNFYQADKRESWNAVQITLVFLTLLIYFIPATLLSRAPVINGRVNYEILFEDNKTLIYVSVIIFASLTMAKNYLVYNNRKAFVYWYYSVAISMVVIALALDSKPVDLMLAVGICVAEVCNHYFFNPIKLP